jgi:hypothetical protein
MESKTTNILELVIHNESKSIYLLKDRVWSTKDRRMVYVLEDLVWNDIEAVTYEDFRDNYTVKVLFNTNIIKTK